MSSNARYHALQKFRISFFSENVKIKLYGALILPIAVRESKTFVSQIRGKI